MRRFWVYILANRWDTVLYTGVTNNLRRRVQEHKARAHDGFTKQYNVTKLVYYEEHTRITDAIAREKQLKRWHRAWKEELIRRRNPTFHDLSDDGW